MLMTRPLLAAAVRPPRHCGLRESVQERRHG
jgi:hypothetical protein